MIELGLCFFRCRLAATNLELFEQLANAIITHWDPKEFDEKLLQIGTIDENIQQRDYIY